MTDIPITPAGWHPDPDGRPTLRWWDGSSWTDQLAPIQTAAAPARATGGTNVMAVLSFVCGLLWLGFVGSVLAVVFGEVARSQLKNDPSQSGRGLAAAGRILGALGVGLLLLLLVSSAFRTR